VALMWVMKLKVHALGRGISLYGQVTGESQDGQYEIVIDGKSSTHRFNATATGEITKPGLFSVDDLDATVPHQLTFTNLDGQPAPTLDIGYAIIVPGVGSRHEPSPPQSRHLSR
jgi:hypothetical protein